MEPEIRRLPAKKFIGMALPVSFSTDKTSELWHTFMPRRGEISHRIGTELYSIEEYPPCFFESFDPNASFKKWAAVEVSSDDTVPAEMQTLMSPEGNYAVFTHKGTAVEAPQTYQQIFQQWLPGSAFLLDDRPHIAIMGAKYKTNSPDSEEEILIPVKPRLE